MDIPLRSLLVIPFVVQIIGVTSVLGYLSYRSCQNIFETLATRLLNETGDLIEQNLDQYLLAADAHNQSHLAALESGIISLDNLDELQRYLTLDLLTTDTATSFLLGTAAGDMRASHRVTASDYGLNTRLTPNEIPLEIVILDRAQSANADVYSSDRLGYPDRYLESIKDIDVRTRSWYRGATATGTTGWSEIFQIGSTNHLAISAFAPIFDDSQDLLGVFAVNVSLQKLNDFLGNLAFAEVGQAFIMQADGFMIATSTTAPTYIAVKPPRGDVETTPRVTSPQQVEFRRLTALESENPVTRAAFRAWQAQVGEDGTFAPPYNFSMRLGDDRYYTHVTAYCTDCGLDWVIVTTVPQSAFLGTLWETIRPTVMWSGFTVLIVIGSGVWLTRRITRPLQQLSAAVLAYADSQAEVLTQPTHIREVEALRQAFSEMMAKTDAQQANIQQFHQNYARSLEAEIAQRTAELRKTTEQLCAAQRIAKVGSWEFDVASGQLSWSAEMFQIVGRDPALGAPTAEDAAMLAVPPGDEQLRQAVAQALTAGVPYELENTIMHPTEGRRYVVNRGEVQRDAQGRIVRLVGTTTDMTASKTTELALAASEENRRLALELTNTGSWEFDIATGQATWSDSHYRLMGLVPQSVPANYEVWRDRVHPDDLAAAETAFQTAIDEQTLLSVEYRVVHPDGQIRWVLTQGRAIYGADGTPERMVGVMLDISDRKQLELALQASESQLSNVLNSARAAILRIRLRPDFQLEFAYVSQNCEQLYGFSAEALMADPSLWQGCIEHEDWASVILPMLQAFQPHPSPPQQFMRTYRYRYPRGALQYVLSHVSVSWNAAEHYWDGTIVDTDITELKLTEQTLQLLSQELQVWRDRYEIAITTGRQVVFEYDFIRQTYTFSQNTSEIFGYDPVDLPATLEESLAMVHPDDVQALTAAIQATQSGPPHAYRLEFRIRCQNGSYLWVEDQARAQLDDTGQPIKIIGFLKDISDRKRAEMERDIVIAQLRQSGENYLAILQHQTELITRFKPDGTILFVNDAFCEYFNVSKSDILGKPYQPFIYPDDQPAIDECIARLSPAHPYRSVEHRVLVRGEVRWMQWTNRAIYDDQGHMIEMQSVGRDIHDRKQAETALRESQAQYQRLVDDIGEKFVVFSHTGESGIITYVSDGIQSVFGLQREDVIGRTWQEAIDWHPESVETALVALEELLTQAVDFQQLEMAFTHPDQMQRTIRISQHPVRDPAGQLLAIEGIIENISDYKQAELELQLLNAQLEELATTDSLTKVANRRQFLTVLAQEWSRHQREGMPLTIIMLDIDHFKAYNDSYGHPVGDRCLTQIAKLLERCMQRSGDLVARYGGEEFILLLPNTDQAGAIEIAQRIQTQMAEQAIRHETSPTDDYVTASLGIVVVQMPTEIDDMAAIAIADDMLYAAKRRRNTYQLRVVNYASEA